MARTMINPQRRRFLKGILGALAGVAGSAVLATAAQAPAPADKPQPAAPGDIQERADRLAEAAGTGEQTVPVNAFANRGFANGRGGGAFRNGGFANGGGGGFRKG